jgi:hypothetical protein
MPQLQQQGLFDDAPKDPSKLHFDSIGSLLSYFNYLTSTKNQLREVDYDSKELLQVHQGKSVLKIDKYIGCALPAPDLEFILESQGIMDYDAYLDPEFNFKHGICDHDGVISEIFTPNLSGDHYNPYIRFRSCVSSASRSIRLLMDLAGLEIKDLSLDLHDSIFLEIVCTFPGSIGYYLVNPVCRNRADHKTSKNGMVHKSALDIEPLHFIDRMNRCRSKFFKHLHKLWGVPQGATLGMSSSLHVWGSEVPILPHAHVHNIVPFFSYHKKINRDPDFLESLNLFDIGLDNLEDYFELIFAEVDITPRRSNKPFESFQSFDSVKKLNKSTTKIVESDKKIIKKYIVDRDKYKKLRLHISSSLKDILGFQQCLWNNPAAPIDIDSLKNLWSDIVYNEFQDIMDHWEPLDIHVSWIPWYKKAKLRSALQYKVRPPVLDLDLFLKKCPGVVQSHTKVDLNRVLDYLDYNLKIAIKCSDQEKINRYESLIQKAELIFDNFSEEDIYSWLQFLSIWKTDTRVYGFWKNLKRYMLDPDYTILVKEEICPICNGSYQDTNIKVKFCKVDYVLIQSRNKYLVYNIKDPPPIPDMLIEGV